MSDHSMARRLAEYEGKMSELPFPRGTTVPADGNEHLIGQRFRAPCPVPPMILPDEAPIDPDPIMQILLATYGLGGKVPHEDNMLVVARCEKEMHPKLCVNTLSAGPGVIDDQLTDPVPIGHLCYVVTRGVVMVKTSLAEQKSLGE